MGRPPEHIIDALKELIEKISKEKGVSLVNHKIHEAKEIEENQNDDKTQKLYTSFAEVEAEFDSIDSLMIVVFNYMPSHLEIISPEEIVLKNETLAELMTGITLRLHRYDEIAKKMIMDNKILEHRLKEIVDAIKDKKHIEIVDEPKEENKTEKSEKKNSKRDKK